MALVRQLKSAGFRRKSRYYILWTGRQGVKYEHCTCLISKTAVSHVVVFISLNRGFCVCSASQWFFCKQTIVLCNKQQLQWAAHVVPWAASTYLNVEAQIILLHQVPVHRAICITPQGSWLHRLTPNKTCAQLLVHSIRV